MSKAAERAELIAKLRNLPDDVEASIAGLTDEQLDIPYGEGEWSLRQIVHHLADAHMNAYIRMKLIITETKPILKPFNQDEWAKLTDTIKMPVQISLSILKGVHARWGVLLESLPEASWERAGVHLENGLVTLDTMLQSYVRHGENHIEQMMRLRKQKGW